MALEGHALAQDGAPLEIWQTLALRAICTDAREAMPSVWLDDQHSGPAIWIGLQFAILVGFTAGADARLHPSATRAAEVCGATRDKAPPPSVERKLRAEIDAIMAVVAAQLEGCREPHRDAWTARDE